jgi:hypothetical protein
LLVNRSDKQFGRDDWTEREQKSMTNTVAASITAREPKEMFDDFPELLEYEVK